MMADALRDEHPSKCWGKSLGVFGGLSSKPSEIIVAMHYP
jgi:hypothetical protein